MPVQLHYVQLITDKTHTAGLSGGVVFAILFDVTRTKKNIKFIIVPQIHQKLVNSDVTKKALDCTASL